MKNAKMYYWIAINGGSCAMSPTVLPPTLKVIPTPEQLIGFPTREEAEAAQTQCLNAPINEVRKFLEGLAGRVGRDIAVIQPTNPGPPTHGQTMWLEADL